PLDPPGMDPLPLEHTTPHTPHPMTYWRTLLQNWVLRRFGRYAGPLYLAMILGGSAVFLAGALATR
ncbi:hypothetical protein ACWCYZ_44880, partial [Streptomyces virginiae]